MHKYIESYGYCIIPAGTVLFRPVDDKKIFFNEFLLKPANALLCKDSYCNAEFIEEWHVIHTFYVVIAISSLDQNSCGMPSVQKLFFSAWDNLPDLDSLSYIMESSIKEHNNFRELSDMVCLGWLTAIPGLPELSLFLLERHHFFSDYILKVRNFHKDKVLDYSVNSLENIHVFPSDEFYSNSEKELQSHGFDSYTKKINVLIDSAVRSGKTLKDAQSEFFNLRFKLKI